MGLTLIVKILNFNEAYYFLKSKIINNPCDSFLMYFYQSLYHNDIYYFNNTFIIENNQLLNFVDEINDLNTKSEEIVIEYCVINNADLINAIGLPGISNNNSPSLLFTACPSVNISFPINHTYTLIDWIQNYQSY